MRAGISVKVGVFLPFLAHLLCIPPQCADTETILPCKTSKCTFNGYIYDKKGHIVIAIIIIAFRVYHIILLLYSIGSSPCIIY